MSSQIIDVISPATACNQAQIQLIKELLQEQNFRTNIFLEKETTLQNSKNSDHEFPSFCPETRFQQFKMAVQNPDSDIIWCTRGGYGSFEIVNLLATIPKPKKSKILIGFSDITSLNKILIEKWNWQVLSAPMLLQIVLNKVSNSASKKVFSLIKNRQKSEISYQLKPIIASSQDVEATLTGGCLSVLAGSFGTKNSLDWHEKILFLEDEGESGERLDRYFSQILEICQISKKFPQAILLGNFLQENEHGNVKKKNVVKAIEKLAENIFAKKLPIALFQESSGCLGHGQNMMPIFLGKKTQINQNKILSQK